MREKSGKKRFMSIDGNNNKEVEANFSNEDVFFTLWFHLINPCFTRVGVCKND